MHSVIEAVIIPLAASVIVAIVTRILTPDTAGPIGSKTYIILSVFVFLLLVVAICAIPPYRVCDVRWVVRQDAGTEISGRMTRSVLPFAVPGQAVQVKIYEADRGDPPFKDAKVAMTDVDGTFTVEFPPPLPEPQVTYLANTAYKYSAFSRERWKIKDFLLGSLVSSSKL